MAITDSLKLCAGAAHAGISGPGAGSEDILGVSAKTKNPRPGSPRNRPASVRHS